MQNSKVKERLLLKYAKYLTKKGLRTSSVKTYVTKVSQAMTHGHIHNDERMPVALYFVSLHARPNKQDLAHLWSNYHEFMKQPAQVQKRGYVLGPGIYHPPASDDDCTDELSQSTEEEEYDQNEEQESLDAIIDSAFELLHNVVDDVSQGLKRRLINIVSSGQTQDVVEYLQRAIDALSKDGQEVHCCN